ncbi:hypothetical protein DOTSEDRAFT_31931 [Dothistroma septosporum NZE10]|uniref:Mid2 domain-containing protein n=1 Tax=Dothistroma septosporum (strain NZE10 / CBS 128990) TaxID=675120 RepID=N1PVU7_DOTSN|nr:hypothetical protein DOTSEDRAFT_31931 [Dothistroma septosporum NZE10]
MSSWAVSLAICTSLALPAPPCPAPLRPAPSLCRWSGLASPLASLGPAAATPTPPPRLILAWAGFCTTQSVRSILAVPYACCWTSASTNRPAIWPLIDSSTSGKLIVTFTRLQTTGSLLTNPLMAGFDDQPASGFSTSTVAFVPATATFAATPTSSSSTASTTPLYGTTSAGQQPNNEYSSGLSSSARKVVICTTTIGGTLILALLIYALWRKRRGVSYSEIVRFRPQSDPDMTGPNPLNERLTALPIYRHKRFSVRSSRHSMTGAPRPPTKKASNRSLLEKNFRSQTPEPLVSPRPQTAKSSKALRKKSSRGFTNATPPQLFLSEPEKARTGRPSEDLPVMGHFIHSKTSYSNMKHGDRPSTGPNPTSLEPDQRPHLHLEKPDSPDRWSWTNSQAPPTPRIIPPGRLSFSARSIRSISSWVTTGSKKRDEEPPKMPSLLRPTPKRQRSRQGLLKNQAVQPILAPPPARTRLSKHPGGGRHGRVGSLSSIFKPNPDFLIPASLSPRGEEPQAGTPGSIEMAQEP